MKKRSVDKAPQRIGFDDLYEGYKFPTITYKFGMPKVSKYLKAVGRQAELPHLDHVPPMTIAACSIGESSKLFQSSPGSIHASQELEFLKTVPIGAAIECNTRVSRKLQRGKVRLLVIEISATDEDKEQVLTGKSTIVLPDQGLNRC